MLLYLVLEQAAKEIDVEGGHFHDRWIGVKGYALHDY